MITPRCGTCLKVILLLLLPGFCRAQELALPIEPPVLRPGDVLKITVWRNAELSGQFTISEHGTIGHPLLRQIEVAGLPMPEVERKVRLFLQGYETEPQFVLEPLLRVFMGGAVAQPNLYRFPPETTLAQAVWLAGGASERANLEKVRLVRDGAESIIDITSPSSTVAQTPIRSGDHIIVSRRTRSWRDYLSTVAGLASVALLLIRIEERVR